MLILTYVPTNSDSGRLASATSGPSLRIPSGGLTLAADAYGDDTDPPVVLLHGGGQTRHSWRRTARRLGADGWYTLTVDLRGHGDSDWSPEGDYALDAFADDVLALRRALGRPPVLIGASLGGIASLAAVGRDPDVARGLVLVDVSPFLQPRGTGRIMEFMRAAPDGFASVADAADAVAAYLPHRERPRDPAGLRKNLRFADGRWYWHWDPAFVFPPEGHDPRLRLRTPLEELSAIVTRLRIPTMLVRGGQSDVLGEDDARRFLDLAPHAEYCDVAGAHHMVAGDDNAVFDVRILDFLQRRIRPRLVLGPAG
ncbi:putative hydrolase or acyltransferase of alpha/beta superfamily [Frankia torreyi]|uniref:Putative hydrolase or acyltransferase of alpha/beta superfamily n=1 Tax=Frankia torreyi TaxID=1856 RepID=A0A0D8BD36_9ACTN|nr:MULTISPECIES: alpha/beta hydrolase [Frankia]KJE21975.1 putative hydrolase or acyltransferase of alpha/beta superfamily [Frankia torreyi]KQM04027.1 putative hydrolase or acyltransferase of alpha/beta superfamily [Frankia sp. CpI1-P]